jgi:DNA-binding NarL/FixJ family response regulator
MGRLDLPDPRRDEDERPPPAEVSLPEWSDPDRRDAALDRVAVAIAVAWAQETAPRKTAAEQLTRRQLEVLQMLGEGLKYGEIARRCGCSLEAVKRHARAARRWLASQ